MIAIDWGTTSLRAARLDAAGQVLEERSSAQGILSVLPGQFAPVFIAAVADWISPGGTFCLMSGMVGSRQGWQEAAYCACPSGFDDIAQALSWIRPAPGGARLAIVPGLSCEHDGVPDVMRGEEVQVFGALRLLGLQDATLVLPGTHSKWVTVRGQRIDGFCTYMTGEFYALLRQHSLLARSLPAMGDAADDAQASAQNQGLNEEAFDQGVAHAQTSRSLLATAFSTRTLALFERMAPQALLSYLSGLVIGEELRSATPQALSATGTPVVVIGSATLTRRYQRALAQAGVTAQCVGADATWQGLWAIAQTLDRSNLAP